MLLLTPVKSRPRKLTLISGLLLSTTILSPAQAQQSFLIVGQGGAGAKGVPVGSLHGGGDGGNGTLDIVGSGSIVQITPDGTITLGGPGGTGVGGVGDGASVNDSSASGGVTVTGGALTIAGDASYSQATTIDGEGASIILTGGGSLPNSIIDTENGGMFQNLNGGLVGGIAGNGTIGTGSSASDSLTDTGSSNQNFSGVIEGAGGWCNLVLARSLYLAPIAMVVAPRLMTA